MPDSALSSPDSLRRLGYAQPSVAATAVRITAVGARKVEEQLAEETPVTMAYNGVAHAVMMATPGDLEDFAIGFSVGEGIVRALGEVTRLDVVRHGRGIELQVEVAGETAARLAGRRRALPGRTGCGICGVEQLDDAIAALPVVGAAPSVAGSAITQAMGALAQWQPLNAASGGAHAAGWARLDGMLEVVREDVGRHNALDKLVGALRRAGTDPLTGFVVMTSRASYELVQKLALLGSPLLACVSAPTALAVRVAHRSGIALAGFAREDRVTLYANADRVHGGVLSSPAVD